MLFDAGAQETNTWQQLVKKKEREYPAREGRGKNLTEKGTREKSNIDTMGQKSGDQDTPEERWKWRDVKTVAYRKVMVMIWRSAPPHMKFKNQGNSELRPFEILE